MKNRKGTGNLVFEDIEIEYSCTLENVDYGVPNSPEWWEPKDIEIEGVWIWGIELKDIPKDLEQEIYERAEEVEWQYE